VPPTRDQILSANDATYEAWNAHDPDAVAAVFAEDAELRDAGNPEPVLGRDAIRARAVDLLVEPPSNADRCLATGRHAGSPSGSSPRVA
jgi:uncharacterized protein (TIGR02246 family)